MIKHLITGGCSFSHSQCPSDNWLDPLVDWLREKNPDLTYEHTHSDGETEALRIPFGFNFFYPTD